MCRGNFISKGPLVDRSNALRKPRCWSPENKGDMDVGWNESGVRLWPDSIFILRDFESIEEIRDRKQWEEWERQYCQIKTSILVATWGPGEGVRQKILLVDLMDECGLRATLFTGSAMQTSALQCSRSCHLFCAQTLQWHPGSKTQRMRSEYSIDVPAADGREPEIKQDRWGTLGMHKQGREAWPKWSAWSPWVGTLCDKPGPSPELSESTYCIISMVLIRSIELGKIKVYLKPGGKELFI